MNWAETIEYIRQQPEFEDLVKQAYFEKELSLNVDRFLASGEWNETWKVVKKYAPKAESLLDVGCGSGFTSVAFSLKGIKVTALEPDADDTIGYGAINKLAKQFNCTISICPSYFENNDLPENSFDIVYARQSMHHAHDLDKFVAEAYRLLKPGGVLLTIRDHIVFDAKDKEFFLSNHPLQKFYGGENAYSEKEYTNAMTKANFTVKKVWRYYDSVLNYFPQKQWRINAAKLKNSILFFRPSKLNEMNIPGRMYSFIAIK
jgi:SAM-dependent methyltransferase